MTLPPNIFSSGIDTSRSAKLNENFAWLPGNFMTVGVNAGQTNSASSTYVDVITLTSPEARKASQTLRIVAWGGLYTQTGGDSADLQIYNNTSASQITVSTSSTSNTNRAISVTGSTTLTNVGDTISIKIRFRRASGTNSTDLTGAVVLAWLE